MPCPPSRRRYTASPPAPLYQDIELPTYYAAVDEPRLGVPVLMVSSLRVVRMAAESAPDAVFLAVRAAFLDEACIITATTPCTNPQDVDGVRTVSYEWSDEEPALPPLQPFVWDPRRLRNQHLTVAVHACATGGKEGDIATSLVVGQCCVPLVQACEAAAAAHAAAVAAGEAEGTGVPPALRHTAVPFTAELLVAGQPTAYLQVCGRRVWGLACDHPLLASPRPPSRQCPVRSHCPPRVLMARARVLAAGGYARATRTRACCRSGRRWTPASPRPTTSRATHRSS